MPPRSIPMLLGFGRWDCHHVQEPDCHLKWHKYGIGSDSIVVVFYLNIYLWDVSFDPTAPQQAGFFGGSSYRAMWQLRMCEPRSSMAGSRTCSPWRSGHEDTIFAGGTTNRIDFGQWKYLPQIDSDEGDARCFGARFFSDGVKGCERYNLGLLVWPWHGMADHRRCHMTP